MNGKKNNLLSLLILIVEVFIGILLIVSPAGLVKGIVVTFGLLLIICGAVCVIPYVRKAPDASQAKMIFGVVLAIIGLIFAVCCEVIVSLFPVIAVLYGIGLLIGAGVKIAQALSDCGNGRGWIAEGIGALVLAVFGILALISPFETVTAVFTLIAIGLFIDAILSVISLFSTVKSR